MLLVSPNPWSCLPTSFAMLWQQDLKALLDELGHDGSEIVRPQLKDPHCRRGFHTQEFVRIAAKHDLKIMEVQGRPTSKSIPGVPEFELDHTTFMLERMLGRPGVLTGYNSSGTGHAVFWTGERVCCPNVGIYDLPNQNFIPVSFWF